VNIVNVKTILASSSLLLALAVPAAAQGQLGAGISFLRDTSETGAGVTVDYAYPIVPLTRGAIAVVGDFGLNKFDGATLTSYLGGIRVRGNLNDKVAPFGQFLVGAQHCCGETDTTIQPGVGIDFAINPTLNFRAQVDFRNVRFSGTSYNSQRYTFGISMPLPAGR
jgi:hypothetical protein